MWFVFPQIAGLGSSAMAQRYAVRSLEEAKAYLAHPVLGDRLRECTAIVAALEGRSAREIFGWPDDLKLRSSMTLFSRAAPSPPRSSPCSKSTSKANRTTRRSRVFDVTSRALSRAAGVLPARRARAGVRAAGQ